MAANVPVSGSGNPMRMGPLWARRTAGKLSVAAAAAPVARNDRRSIVTSSDASGAMIGGRREGCQSARQRVLARLRFLAGRGRYVDDLVLPRMVHAAFVQSVHAHARIVRLDLDAACRAPGVVTVLASADVATLCNPYRSILQHCPGMKTGAIASRPPTGNVDPGWAVYAKERVLRWERPTTRGVFSWAPRRDSARVSQR
jgi:hypothetical protein